MTTIRAARTYDAATIAALGGELGYDVSRQQVATRLSGIESEPSSRVLVAEDGEGRVVGWLHVAARTQLTEEFCAEILGLVVDAKVRGAGVGAALVDAAEAWARAEGCTRIRVRSRDTRVRAHAFYERERYERNKVQVVLHKGLA
jgi:GNAT superfamily N-acetyltransferase